METQIERRSVWKAIGIFCMAVFGGLSSMAVSCGDIFQDIAAWIPTANAAITGIVTLLGPLVPAPAALLITTIKAALSDLAGTITQYVNDTNPADKATLLAKIQTILGDVASNFQEFLTQVSPVAGTVLNIVVGLGTLILSAISGFLAQIHATAPSNLMALKASKPLIISGAPVTITPKYYKHVKDFVTDYNAICMSNNHPEITLK